MKSTETKLWRRIDWLTVVLVLLLVGFGLVSIANTMAAPFTGEENSLSDYVGRLNMEYVQRQIINFLVGVAAMLVVMVVDYALLKPIIPFVYGANVVFLLVLIIAGKTSRGVAGWFILEAIDRAIQPAELCKISIILMLSLHVSKSIEKHGSLKRFKDIIVCLAIVALPTALVMLQPDFGTAFVFICIMAVVFFVARIGWKYIAAAAVAIAAGLPLGYFFLMNDDQRLRIDVFLNPELDPLNAGFHVTQSKIAIGSGQMWGKGYFTEGTLAQLKYVPERHTDFIFAGIVEGLGFIGGLLLIVTFFVLMFRWLWVGIKARDAFGRCIAVGAMGMLLAHVFENIGMTIGLMPVTGIPLPFISYGGSNLLTNMIAVGLVMNVWMRRAQRG